MRSKEERSRASREYLTQIARMELRLRSLMERRAHYREIATSITPRYGTEPGGGSSPDSKVERAALKVAELEEELRAQEGEYADLVREAERAISAVPDPRYRDILTYRYINCWSWNRIARGMHYNRDYIMHLHADAMVTFAPPSRPRL